MARHGAVCHGLRGSAFVSPEATRYADCVPSVIDPTPESFRALKHDTPPDTAIVMLNLLRFREQAAYPQGSGHEACTGKQAYARYAAHALPAIEAVGGKPIFQGSAVAYPIAPADERWDEVLLVRYPNIAAFFAAIMAPAYQAESVHRSAALADARLICTVVG